MSLAFSRVRNPGALAGDLTFSPGSIDHTMSIVATAGVNAGTLRITGAATDGVGGADAGDVAITGGAAGAVTGADGGAVTITGGAAGGFSLGGDVTIVGGAAGGTGGNITINPGTGLGNGFVKIGAAVTCNVTIGAAAGALGFYGAAPQAKPNVTGSRGGNAALASLLSGLAGFGLITDNTVA